jgi:hypothetical protein
VEGHDRVPRRKLEAVQLGNTATPGKTVWQGPGWRLALVRKVYLAVAP